LIIFAYLSFTTVRGQKIGFNSCECTKYLNIANIHIWDVWGKCIFVAFIKYVSFAFFMYIPFATQLFPLRLRHQTSATKLRYLRSSAVYRQPHFDGNIWIQDELAINFDASHFALLKGKWFEMYLYLWLCSAKKFFGREALFGVIIVVVGRGEHGHDQDWISCRILAIVLDQDWIWIFIFEKNWIRTGSGYLFDVCNEICLRVIQDVTNDGGSVFFAMVFMLSVCGAALVTILIRVTLS